MYYIGGTVSFSRNDPSRTWRETTYVYGKAAAFFLKPKLSKVVSDYDQITVDVFNSSMEDIKTLPHAAYTINLCSDDKDRVNESFKILECELRLGKQLNTIPVFHPGTNKNKIANYKQIVNQLATQLNMLISANNDIIIETMAGHQDGSVFGVTFDELSHVKSLIQNRLKFGVCIDTCHIFVSGYDIRTKDTWHSVMNEFEQKIGFNHLRGVHINDSVNDLGSGHDIHAPIGKGKIGLEPFRAMLKDKRFQNIPLVTETHLSLAEMKKEINFLYHIND